MVKGTCSWIVNEKILKIRFLKLFKYYLRSEFALLKP